MADILQIRRDTADRWTSINPVLADGELGYETDTNKFKVGDGSGVWTALPYGGIKGDTGEGVPMGGAEGDLLVKKSATDGDTEWRRTAATSGTVTPPATIPVSGADHTVLADGAGALTISNGSEVNDRLTIIALGGDVDLTITGTDEDQVPSGEARSYLWAGDRWVLSSGGGSMSNMEIPAPKTFVEKWNDGGAGNVTSKMHEWGTGVFLIRYRESQFLQQDFTAVLKINDLGNDMMSEGVTRPGSPNRHVRVLYEASSQEWKFDHHQMTGNIISISKFEEDPDKQPIREIPADPAFVYGWETVYDQPGNTQNLMNFPVDNGRYEVSIVQDSSNLLWSCEIVIDTSKDRNAAVWDEANNLTYTPPEGNWRTNLNGYNIKKIRKWTQVSSAQLPVPNDGWEIEWQDSGNTTHPLTHFVPDGLYECIVADHANNNIYTGHIRIDNEKTRCYAAWDHQIDVIYETSTGKWTTHGGYPLVMLRKYTGIVNVRHSYHPDPRRVGQKDWVTIWENFNHNSANLNFKVSHGWYRVVIGHQGSAPLNGQIYNSIIYIPEGVGNDISVAPWVTGANYYLKYTHSTAQWQTQVAGYYIKRIQKWGDVEAADAPTEPLKDGWKMVWENDTTSTYVNMSELSDGGVGNYLCILEGSGANYQTANLSIPALDKDSFCSLYSGGYAKYDIGDSRFETNNTSYKYKRIYKFTGLLRISAQYNLTSLSDGPNQVQSLNTDSGDVAVTLPASPKLGDLFEVWNTGSNAHKITGLPDSIELGDGKGLRLRYVDGWKYEDVIIDESDSGNDHIIKYAKGLRVTYTSGATPIYDRWK